MAVTSLVLGILGLLMCVPAGVAGIVTGIIALNRASSEPARHGGRGMAIGGIVCGGVGFIMIPFFATFIAVLVPSFSTARELSKRLDCAANMKAIGTAVKMYGSDQGIPTLDILVEQGLITEKQLICPSSGLAESNYILIPLEDVDRSDHRLVILYEPISNHGHEGGNFLFADGHVTFERRQRYNELVEQIELDLTGPD